MQLIAYAAQDIYSYPEIKKKYYKKRHDGQFYKKLRIKKQKMMEKREQNNKRQPKIVKNKESYTNNNYIPNKYVYISRI